MIDYILTAITLIMSGAAVIFGCKEKKNKRNFFQKDFTTVLKGICCIIVIFVHFPPEHGNKLQDIVGSFGYICVTIFFLISAYGMQYSAERKKNYLKHFWRNRLSSLLIPCMLINICVFGFHYAIKGLADWNTLVSINGYVMVLLQYCLAFFIIMYLAKFLKLNIGKTTDVFLILAVVASSLYLYFSKGDANISSAQGWCYERYGLIWGLLLYRYYEQVANFLEKHVNLKKITFCILSMVLGLSYLKFKFEYFYGEYLLKIILGLTIITFIMLIAHGRTYGNKVINYLGKISYEVYLSHGFIMGILAYFFNMSSGLFIMSTVFGTIAFSSIIHHLSEPLVKKLRAK